MNRAGAFTVIVFGAETAERVSESVYLRERGANKSRLNFIKSLFEAQCAD